ncbi:hypothetical protein C8R43DRAFT_961449 [Mycena crocata]|nr:hypothetical protein C8R43DRAFT_961449 [Mycena crocata]
MTGFPNWDVMRVWGFPRLPKWLSRCIAEISPASGGTERVGPERQVARLAWISSSHPEYEGHMRVATRYEGEMRSGMGGGSVREESAGKCDLKPKPGIAAEARGVGRVGLQSEGSPTVECSTKTLGRKDLREHKDGPKFDVWSGDDRTTCKRRSRTLSRPQLNREYEGIKMQRGSCKFGVTVVRANATASRSEWKKLQAQKRKQPYSCSYPNLIPISLQAKCCIAGPEQLIAQCDTRKVRSNNQQNQFSSLFEPHKLDKLTSGKPAAWEGKIQYSKAK